MDKPTELPQELTDEIEISVEDRISLYKRVMSMSVSERIKLALLGNREARNILIKDSNKLVTTAVLKSPKISDAEVVKIVQSRNVDVDLLRIIANKREWTRNYRITYGLVNNPKTPLQVALKFLPRLKERDIKAISKNRNVPRAIVVTAKYILQRQTGG